jgi:L-serine/L-threonine ammonia-lyase
LVEPACGASLATLYDPVEFLMDKENILVIVCGGAGITIAQIEAWKQKFR